MTRLERSRIISQIADAMDRHQQELADLVALEAGATVAFSNQAMSVEMMHDYAELALTFDFDEMVQPRALGGRLLTSSVTRLPVGVCGLLPTWNLPLMLAIRKLGPALAAGCTVVMKAPPQTPLTLRRLAELIAQTDLPAGVFNLVTGDGIQASEVLVNSPKVDMISFTGGPVAARQIMASAAGTIKRVALELGGKSANIVLRDADLAQVIPLSAMQASLNAGQTCSMLSRVFVPRELVGEVSAGMAEVLRSQKVGDPTDPTTNVGPLIRAERRSAVEALVATALDEGATLLAGGARPALERGYYYEPTLLTDVTNSMTIAREEVFGPVLSVIAYDTVDEAIRMTNDSPFGLQANVMCGNVSEGMAVAAQIRSGAVGINGAMDPTRAPRGGFKLSGVGRECGKWALEDYLEYQTRSWWS